MRCCCTVQGASCSAEGHFRVTEHQLSVLGAAPRSKAKGKLGYDVAVKDDGRCWLCVAHFCDAVRAHIAEKSHAGGGERILQNSDLLQGVLRASGTHEEQLQRAAAEEEPLKRRRVTEARPVEEDRLTTLFERARPLIRATSFTYAVLVRQGRPAPAARDH